MIWGLACEIAESAPALKKEPTLSNDRARVVRGNRGASEVGYKKVQGFGVQEYCTGLLA